MPRVGEAFAMRSAPAVDRPEQEVRPRSRRGYGSMLDIAFRQERAGLLRYIGKRAGRDLAADLVQEVFARAAASPQVEQLVNPAGFLYRIAHNLLVDKARRDANAIRPLYLMDGCEPSVRAMQELETEAEEMRRICEQALSRMPERTRSIFLMHRLDGLSYRDIQAEVGITLAGIEYHMMRALAGLRAAAKAAGHL